MRAEGESELEIEVRVFAWLRKFLPEEKREGFRYQAAEGLTIMELLNEVGVPSEEASLILVNGKHALLETRLAAGDSVSVFPPLAGG